MRKYVLFIMIFAHIQGYSIERPEEYVELDVLIMKGVNWCKTSLDNMHYIMTSGEPVKVLVYLEGRKINLKLKNENAKDVTYYIRCNGFVHPENEPVGKEKVDSDYTYTKTLAPGGSYVYTIGHRSMIPVIAHGGVPGNIKDKKSVARSYLDMLYAGFDVSTWGGKMHEAVKMMNSDPKMGIKLIIGGGTITDYKTLADNAKKYNSSVFGYYIGDEPFLKKNLKYPTHTTIDNLIPRADSIRLVDPNADIRICLNPIYGPETIKPDKSYDNQKYADYIDSCILKLGLRTIALDNYSIIWYKGEEVLRRQWFDNLEIIRGKSIKYGIPFCGHVLSAQHLDYLMPTLGKMRLQMYANLAYGAKSIAYYTYWHRWLPGEGSYVAPVDSFGQRREGLYDALNRVNEEMARISPLFAEGTVQQVYHINGAPSNELVKHLTPDNLPKNIKSLSIEGGKSAIASIITWGDASYLAIVNKDFKNPIKIHIKGNKSLFHVSKLNLKNEAITSGIYTIEAGDIIIFNFMQK